MKLNNSIFVENRVIEAQKHLVEQIKDREDRPKKYHIVTFGCQMNVNDSQKLAYMLEQMGMEECASRKDAELVIFNTCCIRENAERKALGNIMWLKELKKERPELLIAVCGCMIQQPEMLDVLLKQYKFIDLAFGTHNLYTFPELLLQFLTKRQQIIAINDEHVIAEGLGSKRDIPHHAYVSIMFGCNNFCTFCIVPYVRGRERSRKFDDILYEVDALVNGGAQEIMLLGQNVNSYGKNNEEQQNFPNLLRRLNEMGVPRIRFMTSHPKDLSDELVAVIAECEHVAKHIHLPIQSGSSKILRAMNRIYNREQYLHLVDKLRSNIPNIGITTDIIVGFPGETEEDFTETLSLVDLVRYDSAFSFIYSKRKGTKAALMDNLPSKEISNERLQRLNKHINEHAHEALAQQLGRQELILIDDISPKEPEYVYGRSSRNIKVLLQGTQEDIGKFIHVDIDKFQKNTLYGKRIQ